MIRQAAKLVLAAIYLDCQQRDGSRSGPQKPLFLHRTPMSFCRRQGLFLLFS